MAKADCRATLFLLSLHLVCPSASSRAPGQQDKAGWTNSGPQCNEFGDHCTGSSQASQLQSASLMQIGRISQPIADAFVDPFATLEDEFDEVGLSNNENKQPFVDTYPSIHDVFHIDSPSRSAWRSHPLLGTIAGCCILAIFALSSVMFWVDRNTIAYAKQTLQELKQTIESDLYGRRASNLQKDVTTAKACPSHSDSESEDSGSEAPCTPELLSALTTAEQNRSPQAKDPRPIDKVNNWQKVNQRLATALEDTAGCSLLHMAVADSLPVELNRLLEQKADVNATDVWEETPLHFAARLNGSAEVCAHLLDHGANINAVNSDGDTPVLLAARAGHAAACDLLLSRGGGTGFAINDAELPPLLTTLMEQRAISPVGSLVA